MPERTRLPNGLTVIVKPDRSAPVVAIVTWVNAGYFDETDDEVGISHVLEHMYFKGTPTRGVGEIPRETKASGGYLNAHTIYDHTSYETVLPAAGFRRGLEIQADAYRNSLLDAAELARELEVIIQEAKRKLDSPAAVAVESLYALLHDRHRLRRWRIGDEPGLRALTRDRLATFYRNFYRPGNTTLVVAGDVDGDAALAEVTRRYGDLTDDAVVRPPGPVETEAPGFRFREMAADVEQGQVVFGWQTPGPSHVDTPALDLAAVLLGTGRGSRLYRSLREREMATQVSAMNYTPRDCGVFVIRTEGDAGRAADAAGAAWHEVLALREADPAPWEVERAQRLFESRWLRRQETMEGQAGFLAEWEALGGWEASTAYYERMMALTARDLRLAAASHLDPDQASLVVHRPRTSPVLDLTAPEVRARLTAATSAPARPPAPVATPAPSRGGRRSNVVLERRAGAVTVFRSGTGLPILVRRRPGTPLVHLGLHVAGGSAIEPAATAGISTIMIRASLKGTPSRDAEAIANASELLGGTIGTGVTADGGGWTLSVPTPRYREALDLLQDVVQHPSFRADAIETERTVALSQLAQLRDDMFRYPVRLALEAAHGAHPYGRSLLGTEDSLRAVTAEGVRDWHRQSVLVAGAVAAAVGDVDEEELARGLADAFGDLGVMPHTPPPVPAWPASPVQRAEYRDKAQTALAIAFPAPARRDPRRHAAELLAGIASGLGGRLFEELRDRRSLAYTVQAWVMERVSAGLFLAYIATDPGRESEARDRLLIECARLAAEPVTDQELARAARYAVGSFAIAQQSGGVMLGEMIDAWLFGSGPEELEAYESRIGAVTAADILEVAAALRPEVCAEGIVRGRA